MSNFEFAQSRLQSIQTRIQEACLKSGRASQDVKLVGASKKQTNELLGYFVQAGLRDFGENYLQEGLEKISSLSNSRLCWHFIGAIQSRKTKLIAEHFDWVHSLDRIKVAKGLDQSRSTQDSEPLNVLLQLNLDQETSKAGVTALEAERLIEELLDLKNLRLRGFMLIPQPRENPNDTQEIFAQARELLERSNTKFGIELDQLSMGMSGDLELAIAEGSTIIRIGTDLFGARVS